MTTISGPSSYFYLAMRPGGRKSVGVRQAGSPAALAQALRADNRLLLKAHRLPAWASRDTGGDLPLKDQQALNEQLSQLLSRGVPLVEALDVAAQTVRPAARPRCAKLRELVSAGSSFADACRTVGGFDKVTIAVYRGAERTGDLAGAAKELSHTARRRMQISGKAVTLMIYPAIVLSISLVVGSLLMLIVVPLMGDGLQKSGIPLPWLSRVVFSVSQWMRDNVLTLVLGVAALLTTASALRANIGRLVKVFMRKAPVIRDVTLAQESARFFSVMAAMTRTGVPIGDALAVANQAVSHPELRGQLDRLRQRLIEGGLLRALIDEVTILPLATRRLLVAAERSGDLESAFVTLASDMTEEVDRTSSRALAVMEPGLVVLMFLIIGALLLAIMLPMLTMTSKMNLG
jgi:type II secretory pathway component PulF